MSVYDVNGNNLGSDMFDVTSLSIYNDGTSSERQGIITYDGKKLYPINQEAQRTYKPKVYNGGVLLALGDSYTSMAVNEFNAFAQSHGLVCDNLGEASTTIAGSADGITVGYHPFWLRLDTEIASFPKTINGTVYRLSDVKLVTFMGGANDWYTVDESQGIDRLGDATSTNKEQLWGALKYIFETLFTTFPNADIIVILQPSNVASNDANYSMWLKEGIVRDSAEMYGLPICDCRFDWYNPTNATDLATYWKSDLLHLNDDGKAKLFEKLEKTLNTLQFYRGS